MAQIAAKPAPAVTPAVTPAGLDPYRLRTDFPILGTVNRSASRSSSRQRRTSLKPLAVIEAWTATTASIRRTSIEASMSSPNGHGGRAARASTAKLINAPEAAEIIFVRNATEAINLVAYSWGRRNIGRGDTIVLTEMEHHANLVPWQIWSRRRTATSSSSDHGRRPASGSRSTRRCFICGPSSWPSATFRTCSALSIPSSS